MELIPIPAPPYFVPVRTDCIGGNRVDYSLNDYDSDAKDTTQFKLMQEIVMTPYKQLHATPDIVGARRATRTDISKYYLKGEDLLPEDRDLKFGERFAPTATANWEFEPTTPTQFYEEYPVFSSIVFAGASLSGGPGAPGFLWDGVMPNIDFKYKIGMKPLYVDGIPYVHVTLEAEHNLYPAYEVIVGKSDDSYVFIYKNKPTDTTFPGPYSLNFIMTAEGIPTDIQ